MRRTAVRPARRVLARALAPVPVLALVLVLVAAFAAGCSDDKADDGAVDEGAREDQPVVALTADQIAQAVLQPENLGDGWTSEPSTDDEGTAPGCLADVETLTDQLPRQDRGGTEYSFGDALQVESTVSVYADETAVGAIFDQVQTLVAACTTVTGPDSDGNEWDLTLTTSDEAVHDEVDDQYRISGNGTVTTPDGTAIEIYIEQTAVRLGPNVASISTSDLRSRTTEHADFAVIAVARLVDVAEGTEPEATTAPAPSTAS